MRTPVLATNGLLTSTITDTVDNIMESMDKVVGTTASSSAPLFCAPMQNGQLPDGFRGTDVSNCGRNEIGSEKFITATF